MPDLGPMELGIILVVIILLFGAKKLPELARGSGQALRIFKQETTGTSPLEPEASPDATFPQAPGSPTV
jgi:sec-independent protein translocase protein TatA